MLKKINILFLIMIMLFTNIGYASNINDLGFFRGNRSIQNEYGEIKQELIDNLTREELRTLNKARKEVGLPKLQPSRNNIKKPLIIILIVLAVIFISLTLYGSYLTKKELNQDNNQNI